MVHAGDGFILMVDECMVTVCVLVITSILLSMNYMQLENVKGVCASFEGLSLLFSNNDDIWSMLLVFLLEHGG